MNKKLTTELELLETAARLGHAEEVLDLLRDKVPPAGSALAEAVIAGNAECVRLLLEWGAPPNPRTEDWYTALHETVGTGRKDIMALLLQYGADPFWGCPEALDYYMDSASDCAIKQGDLTFVQAVVENMEGALTLADPHNGYTLLHEAAYYQQEEIVRYLLEQGASPYLLNRWGETAMDFSKSSIALPLFHAKNEEKKASGMPYLGEEPADTTPFLIRAVRTGRESCVEDMLDKHERVTQTDKDGNTPLHIAAAMGKHTLVRMLLQHGAKVQALNTRNETPLHLACQQDYDKVAKMLLKAGGNPSAIDAHGFSALDYARFGQHSELIGLLEKYAGVQKEV